MKHRYRSIIDVYVLLRRGDGRILLLERANTGYADGQLCPPSGHLEQGESVIDGAIREASEEVGITIDPGNLTFVHVVHHRAPGSEGRIGFFFLTEKRAGHPLEPGAGQVRPPDLERPKPGFTTPVAPQLPQE